jgi:DNA polymerase
VVVTLGNFSTKLLLRTEVGITRMRGVAYAWWGRYLVPTFHPAAALRGGERVKNDIRADLALVRAVIDGRLPSEIREEGGESDAEQGGVSDDDDSQLDLFGDAP